MQPIEKDKYGELRFKENAIVRYLLDNGGIDLNKIAVMNFNDEDRQQFAQLIGYSLSGYSDLDYVSDYNYSVAVAIAEGGLDEKDARIAYLEQELNALRDSLRKPIARLFGIHPDDLQHE